MTTRDTRALLQSLLARKSNSPEFALEIEGYIDDLANDELDATDRKYIGDVAKRLGVIAAAANENAAAPAATPTATTAAGDTKFERAKAAFAEMFDPDNLDPDAPDAALRREIYEEFAAELDRIEHDDN